MYSILGVIYIVFIILTMFLIVRDKKNKEINKSITGSKADKKIVFLIILCIMLTYYIIGYICDTDILNFITFRKNGVSFSFIGMGLLFITSLFIRYIISIISKAAKRN